MKRIELVLCCSTLWLSISAVAALAQRTSAGANRANVPAVQSPVEVHQKNTGEANETAGISIGNFGLIDFPGSTGTIGDGINAKGQIVGGYDGKDVLSYPAHSFVLKGSSFKAINYPGATSTEANAINDSGVVVGYYEDSASAIHGFQYSGSTYKSIDHPGAQANSTEAWGINKAGDIVGGYFNGTIFTGFLLSQGVYSDINVPGSTYTLALGINKAGQIVGWYGDTAGNVNGFLYESGTYTTLDYPGYPEGYAEGINDNGQIVGGYGNLGGQVAWQHGFLYQNGQYTSFDVPFGPPVSTLPSNINNHGTIVGTYEDATGVWYGFVATVGQ